MHRTVKLDDELWNRIEQDLRNNTKYYQELGIKHPIELFNYIIKIFFQVKLRSVREVDEKLVTLNNYIEVNDETKDPIVKNIMSHISIAIATLQWVKGIEPELSPESIKKQEFGWREDIFHTLYERDMAYKLEQGLSELDKKIEEITKKK